MDSSTETDSKSCCDGQPTPFCPQCGRKLQIEPPNEDTSVLDIGINGLQMIYDKSSLGRSIHSDKDKWTSLFKYLIGDSVISGTHEIWGITPCLPGFTEYTTTDKRIDDRPFTRTGPNATQNMLHDRAGIRHIMYSDRKRQLIRNIIMHVVEQKISDPRCDHAFLKLFDAKPDGKCEMTIRLCDGKAINEAIRRQIQESYKNRVIVTDNFIGPDGRQYHSNDQFVITKSAYEKIIEDNITGCTAYTQALARQKILDDALSKLHKLYYANGKIYTVSELQERIDWLGGKMKNPFDSLCVIHKIRNTSVYVCSKSAADLLKYAEHTQLVRNAVALMED